MFKIKNKNVKGQGLLKRIYKHRVLYMFMIPFMAFLIVFSYAPMYGVTLAFKDFRVLDGILGSPWAGLKYFKQLFSGYTFFRAFKNTLILSMMTLFIGWPVPIILALFISEIRNDRAKKIFQTVSYLPHFLSWVIAASLIDELLSLTGPINEIIQAFGGESIYFMADSRYFRWILILSGIWKGCGWSAIVYVAAIAGIDQELYEAARIDGANKLQEIWHITLPGIRSTILLY